VLVKLSYNLVLRRELADIDGIQRFTAAPQVSNRTPSENIGPISTMLENNKASGELMMTGPVLDVRVTYFVYSATTSAHNVFPTPGEPWRTITSP
jgi:hypothetical protein